MKPRRRGYVHRSLVAVREHVGITEAGELIEEKDFYNLMVKESHVWVTHDPTFLLNLMLAKYGDNLRYKFTDCREPDENVVAFQTTRLATFGLNRDFFEGRHIAQHTVWQPSRMFSTPKLAADLVSIELDDLMRFAVDVRAWCKENNLPLKSTLPGLAASLMRDKRFWPNPRGRVPRATNERIRPYLPGVYQESRAPKVVTIPTAISLDQTRAYHRAAQQLPTPNPTNLYARGYFNDPEIFLSDSSLELWAPRGSSLYQRVSAQPGLVAVIASSRPIREGEWRAPCCNLRERSLRYVWTNELSHCQRHGLQIEGIAAAWTSEDADDGLPKYGAWCEEELDRSDEFRRAWLKPTLHSLYGLLGARPRDLLIGNSHGKGHDEIYTMRGYVYPVKEIRLPTHQPETTNVAALGVLQSAIRERTLELANEYPEDTLHVHADGLHLRATQLAMIPEGWTAEPVTNLQYLDDVSWLSEERDVLPGRDQWQRLETRRRLANEVRNAARRTRGTARQTCVA